MASYLRTRGSDSLEIHQIAATDFEEYRQINELVLRGKKITEDIILVCGDEATSYDNVVPSKAADAILDMARQQPWRFPILSSRQTPRSSPDSLHISA